jgi:hypothetical protein
MAEEEQSHRRERGEDPFLFEVVSRAKRGIHPPEPTGCDCHFCFVFGQCACGCHCIGCTG